MQRKLKLKAHKRYALKCKFSPDSTLLATTSADQTAKIWRTADLLPLSERAEHELGSGGQGGGGGGGGGGGSGGSGFGAGGSSGGGAGGGSGSGSGGGLNCNWPLAENISPLAVLSTPNQRWVWDVAFSSDSQYVITGGLHFFLLLI